jgi:hypothetical protein
VPPRRLLLAGPAAALGRPLPGPAFTKRAAAHVAVGAALLGCTAFVMARAERATLRAVAALRRGGRAKHD